MILFCKDEISVSELIKDHLKVIRSTWRESEKGIRKIKEMKALARGGRLENLEMTGL